MGNELPEAVEALQRLKHMQDCLQRVHGYREPFHTPAKHKHEYVHVDLLLEVPADTRLDLVGIHRPALHLAYRSIYETRTRIPPPLSFNKKIKCFKIS